MLQVNFHRMRPVFYVVLFTLVLLPSGHTENSFLYVKLPQNAVLPPKTTNTTSPLSVYFEVCQGMFNQWESIAAALWLVAYFAQLRQSGHPHPYLLSRPIILHLPPMFPSLGSKAVVPFEHFFDLPYLTQQLSLFNVSVVQVWPGGPKAPEQACGYPLYVPVSITRSKKRGRKVCVCNQSM